MNSEYLVTGGAGFIGANIVHALVAAGQRVRVLDNLATGRAHNLRDLDGKLDFRNGDVCEPTAVREVVRGVRCVLHLAALPSVPGSVEDPAGSNAVNLTGTLNVLLAARDAKVGRVVFSSSSAVYGDSPELPKREGMPPAPLSPYAVQKLAGEYYARIFHDLYGLETFCLRYFNVFGPRQNPASQYAAVVPLFIRAALRGAAPVIYGDGRQTRDFVFVEDVVRANLRCCAAPAQAAGAVYNIAAGSRMSVRELAETVIRVIGTSVEPRYEPPRTGDIQDSQADISRARDVLQWTPQVAFEAGLQRTVEWFAHAQGQ
jgi:nucleoside-diphosphate-sugar epimerase